MGKRKKIIVAIESVLIAITLCFIFQNSILSKQQSSSQSGQVYSSFIQIFDAIFGQGVITQHVFRKMAHAVEFFVLGVEVYLLYYTLVGLKLKRLFEILCIGLIVGLVDESIQVFSNRGAQVLDVWIDFAGYLLGVVICLGCVLVVKSIIKRRNKKHTT